MLRGQRAADGQQVGVRQLEAEQPVEGRRKVKGRVGQRMVSLDDFQLLVSNKHGWAMQDHETRFCQFRTIPLAHFADFRPVPTFDRRHFC